MRSARDRQVRRALAAERSRQRRTTDEEIAAYREWIRRAIPWVIALNFAMIVLLIWQGVYGAIAANLTVMPMLWLCWWLIRIAEARESNERLAKTARKAWTTVSDDHRDDDEREGEVWPPGHSPGPRGPIGPMLPPGVGVAQTGHVCVFIMGREKCEICGRPYEAGADPLPLPPLEP